MKAMMELNANDIKRVFADYYGLDEEEVSVSPRAKVLIPGDAAPRTFAPAPCDPCEPTQPECGECGYAETSAGAAATVRMEAPPDYTGVLPDGPEPETAQKPASRVERMFGKREDWNMGDGRRKVKGFLILKCAHCGRMKSLFLREEQDSFKCYVCGGEMELDSGNLKPVYTRCPNCENQLKYRTNSTAERIEIPCRQCGAPIDCELNSKGTAYNTVS